jgi:hypothetical protein
MVVTHGSSLGGPDLKVVTAVFVVFVGTPFSPLTLVFVFLKHGHMNVSIYSSYLTSVFAHCNCHTYC